MLLVHDLMLLLTDDESGKQRCMTSLPALLGGAMLVELAAAGIVDVVDDRLAVRPDAQPPTEPLLSEAARVAGDRAGDKPDRVLAPLAKGVRDRALDDLVAAGILSAQERRALGLFRTTRHPAVSSDYEDALRVRLTAVLEGKAESDAQTGPLLALLHATGYLFAIVPVSDKRAAKAVAEAVSAGDWAAESVRRSVRAAQSVAVLAATTAATTAAIS